MKVKLCYLSDSSIEMEVKLIIPGYQFCILSYTLFCKQSMKGIEVRIWITNFKPSAKPFLQND